MRKVFYTEFNGLKKCDFYNIFEEKFLFLFSKYFLLFVLKFLTQKKLYQNKPKNIVLYML